MKKPFTEKLIHVMEISALVLLLVEAYLNHKEEVDESILRLKDKLTDKGDITDGEQTTED